MSPFYELLAVFEGGRILTFCFVNLHVSSRILSLEGFCFFPLPRQASQGRQTNVRIEKNLTIQHLYSFFQVPIRILTKNRVISKVLPRFSAGTPPGQDGDAETAKDICPQLQSIVSSRRNPAAELRFSRLAGRVCKAQDRSPPDRSAYRAARADGTPARADTAAADGTESGSISMPPLSALPI